MGGNKHRIRSLKTRFFLGSLSFHLPPISLTLFHLFLLPTFLSLLTTLSKFQSPQPKSSFFFFQMQAYRALFMKWYPDKNSQASSPKQEAEPKLKPSTETYEVHAYRYIIHTWYMHVHKTFIESWCFFLFHATSCSMKENVYAINAA